MRGNFETVRPDPAGDPGTDVRMCSGKDGKNAEKTKPKRSRNHCVGIRLDEKELEQLQQICRKTGLGKTEVIVSMIQKNRLEERPERDLRNLLRAMDRIESSFRLAALGIDRIDCLDSDENLQSLMDRLLDIEDSMQAVRSELENWRDPCP